MQASTAVAAAAARRPTSLQLGHATEAMKNLREGVLVFRNNENERERERERGELHHTLQSRLRKKREHAICRGRRKVRRSRKETKKETEKGKRAFSALLLLLLKTGK